MSAEKLLVCLDKVRKTGQGRFIACCPAHADKSPSLAIRDMDDGRTLIHCFSGCNTEQVLSAVGLTFADLMPEPKGNSKKGEKRPFAAADALSCLSFEAMVVMCAAKSLSNGKPLPESDVQRLMKSVELIEAGLAAAGVN